MFAEVINVLLEEETNSLVAAETTSEDIQPVTCKKCPKPVSAKIRARRGLAELSLLKNLQALL